MPLRKKTAKEEQISIVRNIFPRMIKNLVVNQVHSISMRTLKIS
jgi:hypothetical protein